QLLDAALVPEFVAYRARHADRLFDHVTSFLAVLPSGVGKRRSSHTASIGAPDGGELARALRRAAAAHDATPRTLQTRKDDITFLRDSAHAIAQCRPRARGLSLAPHASTDRMPS